MSTELHNTPAMVYPFRSEEAQGQGEVEPRTLGQQGQAHPNLSSIFIS